MINVKYVVKLVNPITDYLYSTDDLKNESTLSVSINNSGATIQGGYFKNGVYLNASSQMPIGDDYYVNNNGEIVFQNSSANVLDVEEVFTINNKRSFEIDPKLLSNMNVLKPAYDMVYKMDHIIQSREDIVLFKINEEGYFTMVDCIFNGPSHLVEIFEPLTESESYVYFVVSETLKIGEGNPLHISSQDLIKLPEGFVTLKNRLTSKSGIKFLNTTGGALIHTYNPEELISSYPVEIDGVETSSYQTYSREFVNVGLSQSHLFLNSLEDYDNNITVIYEIAEDGSHTPTLCLVASTCKYLLDGYDVSYTTNQDELQVLLQMDEEFKKKYIYVQYKIFIKVGNTVYQLVDTETLLNLLNNIKQFSNKIVQV